MSIWVNSETKVVVQGITGKEGRFHTEKCREYGTKIVAGVTPGKAGQDVDGVPVFNTVQDAVAETNANAPISVTDNDKRAEVKIAAAFDDRVAVGANNLVAAADLISKSAMAGSFHQHHMILDPGIIEMPGERQRARGYRDR